MAHEQILTETRGRVGIITLNRPERLNAFTGVMQSEIQAQVRAWNADDGIGAMVLTGAGRAFSAGADVGGFEDFVRWRRGAASAGESVRHQLG